MFEDIIKKKECRNCKDKKCDCDSEEETQTHYTCIGCDRPIKVGHHCPICSPGHIAYKKKVKNAYEKFIEAVNKTGL